MVEPHLMPLDLDISPIDIWQYLSKVYDNLVSAPDHYS